MNMKYEYIQRTVPNLKERMPNSNQQINKENENLDTFTSNTDKTCLIKPSSISLRTTNKTISNEKKTTFNKINFGKDEEKSQNEICLDNSPTECDKDTSELTVRPNIKTKDSDVEAVTEDEEDNKEFLKYLELEPNESKTFKRGRTACTITKKLTKPPNFANFGFSICWMNPPRIDGIKPGFPAESCGLKCGDYIIFVDKTNVTMKGQTEVLQIFEEAGSSCFLEIYRPCKDEAKNKKKKKRPTTTRSISTPLPCTSEEVDTTQTQTRNSVSMDICKKSMDLPELPPMFESIVGDKGRLEGINQLINTEKYYIACLQFGIARFLLPLAERKDLCSPKDHSVMFQNSQELLRISEDILEKVNTVIPDSVHPPICQNIGEIYFNKMNASCAAYRKYCRGLKKAFCILAEKTRNKSFMKLLNEPPIPKKRPDLIGFLHKPLEHFRLILKLLQSILNCTAQDSKDYQFLSQVVNQFQVMYKEMTVESGLMEPKGDGKPLLTLQDLESRLVFTRCKPFTLELSGRSWIFGGDLIRIEGNVAKRFWALLFTDIIVFAKVSRDRVIFITEEPLPLLQIVHAVYNIRRKETDFRLVLSDKPRDADSPVASSCGNLSLPLFPNVLKKSKSHNYKRHLIRLRAPTVELKAVWQNLINRQVIYLNTGRGTTPVGTPDSQDLFVDWESNPQTLYPLDDQSSKSSVDANNKTANQIIEYKCNKLAKMGLKESAIHLSKWMKGEIGSSGTPTPGSELDFDVWSEEALKKRTSEITTEHEHIFYTDRARNISRCEVFLMSKCNTPMPQPIENAINKVETIVELHDRPKTRNTNEFEDEFSNYPTKSNICQNCHIDGHSPCHNQNQINVNDISNSSNESSSSNEMSYSKNTKCSKSNVDKHNSVPQLALVPPTPPTRQRTISIREHKDETISLNFVSIHENVFTETNYNSNNHNNNDEESVDELPYLPLNSNSKLKKFNSRCDLEKITDCDFNGDDDCYYYESDEENPQNDADDNDDDDDYYSDEDEEEINDHEQARIINILNRASSFMGEKFATIEKLVGDDKSVAFTFFDRYLRSKPSDTIKPLPATSITLGGEDDCETLSGSEKWGTPTSGGESELQSPVSNEFSDEMDDINPLEELLANAHITTLSLRFPPTAIKSRLEPLPEDEEESYYSDSPDNSSTNTSSRIIQDESIDDSLSIHTSRSLFPSHSSSLGFFNRLILRRSKSVETPRKENSKLSFFNSRTRSEDNTSSKQYSSKNTLSIETTDNHSSVFDTQGKKIREKGFWNNLKKKDKNNKKQK